MGRRFIQQVLSLWRFNRFLGGGGAVGCIGGGFGRRITSRTVDDSDLVKLLPLTVQDHDGV